MPEVRLLDLIRRSPYAGGWLRDAVLAIETDRGGITWSRNSVLPRAPVGTPGSPPVDATLHCSASDLDRMLGRQLPEAPVRWTLGDRDAAPRLKQARAMLAASALGWMGPLPDADADPGFVAEVRRACMEIALGPADEQRSLFPADAPPELARLTLRVTDGAPRKWASVGLSDTAGRPELWTSAGPRVLRFGVLTMLEAGLVPETIQFEGRTFTTRARPLPLPHAISALVEIVTAG